MRRDSGKIWFWAVTLIIALGLSLLAWALTSNNASTLDIIGWITGALLPALIFLFGELQKRYIHFFLFVNRIRGFFNTNTLTWSLSANFQDETIDKQVLGTIVNKLTQMSNAKTSIKTKQVNEFNQIVEISPGPTLDIAYTPGEKSYNLSGGGAQNPYIHVSIRNYRIGYRQVRRTMKHAIAPALEVISSVVTSSERKYSLSIDFDKSANPFFGLYIANIPPEIVADFSIRLNLNSLGHNTNVLISEKKVAINTDSQRTLEDLALEFLAFEYSSAEYLSNA